VTNAPIASRETAEVVHEALIRHWPKLIDWVDRDRAFQSWLRQIRSNVELWSADPSDDGPLLRGGMLAQARDWLDRRRGDLSPAELRYIEASLALQRRSEEEREASRQAESRRQQEVAEAAVKLANEQRRRARIAALGGTVALILAVIAIIAGYEFYAAQQRADDNARAARAELLAMEARRAEAQAYSSDVIELGGALALEAMEMARSTKQPAEADAIEAAASALAGLPLIVLTHGARVVTSLAVLADGRLASGGQDGKIKLWPKAGTGEPVVLTHGAGVNSLAVLADGRLASGGDDGTIKLWPKAGTGEPVVLTHGAGVNSLAVLADGRLASGGYDGKIKLWLVEEQRLIAALCLRAGRNLSKAEWARYIGSDTPWQPSCRNLPSNWRTPD
jgi:WD domain, G-beta repeat